LLPSIEYSIPVVSVYRNLIASGDLTRRGLLAVNVDLRYIDAMIEDGMPAAVAGTSGGGFLLIHRDSALPLAGRKTSAEEAARILQLIAEGGAGMDKPLALGSSRYFVSATVSQRFPFAYVLLTPEAVFYRIPFRIAATAIVFAVLALALGGALILASTRRNFALLDGIIAIVDAAGKGRELPAFQKSKNEDLDFVSLSILRTFVEHDYYKVRLSEQELRRRTLELLALQAQMSPHFLFNTLTSISFKAMALTGKPNDLTKMVEHLSRILGYALKDPRKTVSLREEVEYAADYLEIQRLRFGDRVTCEWRIAQETLDAACPRLLLQPLLENAAEHGRKRSGESVHITITSSLEAGRLRLSVEDDGEGMSAERLAEILAEAEDEKFSVEHIGLINTLKRLRLSFGEECSYAVRSVPGGGTVVELGCPYRQTVEEPESAAG
jgi:two-component system sensor histidine kinase YesM